MPPGGSFTPPLPDPGLASYGTIWLYSLIRARQQVRASVTTFTWNRKRSGYSQAASTDTILSTELAQYAPGTATTVRRIIVDWYIDLVADDKPGNINSATPTTVAILAAQSDSDTIVHPTFGPDDNPDLGWWWWGGAYFTNAYGYQPFSTNSGAVIATGHIDLQVSHNLVDSLYTTLWLVSEVKDQDSDWSSFAQISWGQVLTAPTVG